MDTTEQQSPKALRGRTLQESLLADGKAIRIPLTKGKEALVDLVDFENVSGYEWFAHFNGSKWYAMRMDYPSSGRVMLRMHREIVRPQGILKVDHEDRDGLNNRRLNLRPCNVSQNGANAKPRSDSLTGYKGVHYCKGEKRNKKWLAHIGPAGKGCSIGHFNSAEEAARAYDKAAIERYGKFARLNFPKTEGDANA